MTLIDYLKDIADAIRYAEGSTDEINAQSFETRIRQLRNIPVRPVVPQTGTWQLKTTTDKKYLIIGTDDDVPGNTSFFRMLRSYNIPYTMNITAEYLDRQLGADTNDYFTDEDAPSLFPDGATVAELGKYLVLNNLGEAALHGVSEKPLWNSAKFVGDTLTTIYNTYVSDGGTKSEEEFRAAVMSAGADNDIAQGASYIENSRAAIEEAIGDFVYTAGIWGGEPKVVVDGITVNLKTIRDFEYPFREKNFSAAGLRLTTCTNNTGVFDITRDSFFLGHLDEFKNNVSVGKVSELFVHNTKALDIAELRNDLAEIKSMVDAGEIAVVTRRQYADLGEYVDNPIKSIAVTRTSTTINVGDTDSKDEYTIIATYADNTTANVTEEAIVKIISDTTEARVVSVPAYYRGFTGIINIEVSNGESIYVDCEILENMKVVYNNAVLAKGIGSKVYRYDITGLDTIYFNSTKSKKYLMGYSVEPFEADGLTHELQYWDASTYYPPGSNEMSVPEGMNYIYVNSNSSDGYEIYPFSVTKQPIQ